MTRDQIALMRQVEWEACYGEPLEVENACTPQSVVQGCLDAGWIRREDDDLYLTEAGHAAISDLGR